MENRSTHNLANPALWIRLVYMILFWLLLVVARFAIGLLGLLQFLLVLLTGTDNERLRGMGESISQWVLQAMRFLTFNSERKPFPFQDWPRAEELPLEVVAAPPFEPVPPPPLGQDTLGQDDDMGRG